VEYEAFLHSNFLSGVMETVLPSAEETLLSALTGYRGYGSANESPEHMLTQMCMNVDKTAVRPNLIK
jgi:hypothetical protein